MRCWLGICKTSPGGGSFHPVEHSPPGVPRVYSSFSRASSSAKRILSYRDRPRGGVVVVAFGADRLFAGVVGDTCGHGLVGPPPGWPPRGVRVVAVWDWLDCKVVIVWWSVFFGRLAPNFFGCPNGGVWRNGSRARFRIWCPRTCKFKSCHPYP